MAVSVGVRFLYTRRFEHSTETALGNSDNGT
jgi:hypothetical protein